MNEKIVKVDIDFNEALRRIAHTPKGVVSRNNEQSDTIEGNAPKGIAKKKTAPPKKKDTV